MSGRGALRAAWTVAPLAGAEVFSKAPCTCVCVTKLCHEKASRTATTIAYQRAVGRGDVTRGEAGRKGRPTIRVRRERAFAVIRARPIARPCLSPVEFAGRPSIRPIWYNVPRLNGRAGGLPHPWRSCHTACLDRSARLTGPRPQNGLVAHNARRDPGPARPGGEPAFVAAVGLVAGKPDAAARGGAD